ncbi:MAG TPA: acyl-ACP--UDP-N-acetylglucosamine O-acyltransferase, partial [Planctomycetota bacterium]|nr:acyl-ACP--UDP-N-acetylglucosamine O-acyltransferase [Planctomycetota bacterium]
MAASIHPTAIVDPKAELADGVQVGPYAIIEGGVKIGAGTKIWQHAYVAANTTIGTNNQIHPGAIIGHIPQDLNWAGGASSTVIGNDNVIREYVQIHRASKPGSTTKVGNHCYIMAGAHIAHDCTVGDKVIMANHVLLAGYVEIGDGAFLSGGALVHQFTRVGKLCILQGKSACGMHVPPYMLVAGINEVHGLNIVGMKRWPGLSSEA